MIQVARFSSTNLATARKIMAAKSRIGQQPIGADVETEADKRKELDRAAEALKRAWKITRLKR